MPIGEQSKHYYNFVAGLFTEVTPLTSPEGSLTDTANFKLNIDGSIQRRKGLAPETNAETNSLHASWDNDNDAVTTHFWRNTGGLDSHFQIVQMGSVLYFFDDDSDTLVKRDDNVDISTFKVSGAAVTDADFAAEPVDISWGRGQALVTQRYCDPFVLTFDPVTNLVTTQRIIIRVRDFVGIEDGSSATTQPTALSDIHRYNLENAGWLPADYAAYQVANSAYPARNQVWHRGYRRDETTGGTYRRDGDASFNAAKMLVEPFGRSSAKRGRFLQDPFDTTANGGSGNIAILTWSGLYNGSSETFTITTDGNHNFSVGDTVSIAGQLSEVRYSFGFGTWDGDWSFDGLYTINSENGTDQFTITVTTYVSATYQDQYKQLGEAQVGIDNPLGSSTDLRPTTNAYFAGRAWYAGTPALQLGQRVLFSQIIQRDEQYGRAYQAADPTSKDNPDIIESDGGDVYIPEAGRVIKLQAFGPSMLVMCENGIWEIDGGGNRYFDALDFSVRRVSQVGCISAESVVEADQTIVFASAQGAYRIFVDPKARVLVTEPITETNVNRKWTSIPLQQMKSIKTIYDPVEKRIMWLYDTDDTATTPTWSYTEVLIYDVRLDAFYLYTVPEGTTFTEDTFLKSIVRPAEYVRSGEVVFKFLSVNENDEMVWNEMSDGTWVDFGELDAAAFMETGYESMGDASKDLQVKHITTFMERIEDSSLKLRGRWDFAGSGITGKYAPEQECYRPPRAYLGAPEDDGYPVVFTKLTMPGQGLVLQARFDSVAGADCKIYGWSIDFQGLR